MKNYMICSTEGTTESPNGLYMENLQVLGFYTSDTDEELTDNEIRKKFFEMNEDLIEKYRFSPEECFIYKVNY